MREMGTPVSDLPGLTPGNPSSLTRQHAPAGSGVNEEKDS